ncbi:MAG: hypothetical protein IKV79_01090 [Oscillospiraceae bacterium]|nr:hypothetical protein [Oscillospiraceae bacterium]
MDENIHAGHRDRLKERFDENGLKAFSDIEALELLLFYAIPRCSTNEIAHRLIDRFGSFKNVMEADASELSLVKGVGENAARLIRIVSAMNARYLAANRRTKGSILGSTESMVEYMYPLFAYTRDELAFAICLNGAGAVIGCHELSKGMSNKVEFSARQIISLALRDNAIYMILAHNHLNDIALPSKADVASTKAIEELLGSIGVCLFDHFIISGNEYVSMRESGFFKDE